MFILNSKETIKKAIERAKAVHPKVRVKAFGEYEVTGAAGNLYKVRCERRNGLKVIDCDCVAGTFGTLCFHAAAAIAKHTYLASTPLAMMS
ncbi:MAG: hypothetical protein M3362_19100 [Acidobacteriota bacterium]|nr:hypothetical protein [Acidobacteriota bacterium]